MIILACEILGYEGSPAGNVYWLCVAGKVPVGDGSPVWLVDWLCEAGNKKL